MKLAVVQCDVAFSDPGANAANLDRHLQSLSGVHLALFPECFLTGYVVGSTAQAASIAIGREHPVFTSIRDSVEKSGVSVAFGFAESDSGRLYNTAALFVAGEPPRFYRKTHLPHLGYDRFAEPGSELRTFTTGLGQIGVLICYDQRPCEPARILALQGAELILLPTNWPEGAELSAGSVCLTRAAENRVWMATANRVGIENGARFIGQSKIISPTGVILASAGFDEEVLIADVDLAVARQKRTVIIPDEYELDVMGSRRPDLYGAISEAL